MTTPASDKSCSCREESCPLGGMWNIQDIVYKAEIKDGNSGETSCYIRMTSERFRQRFNKHSQSLINLKYKNESKLLEDYPDDGAWKIQGVSLCVSVCVWVTFLFPPYKIGTNGQILDLKVSKEVYWPAW